MVKFQQGIIKFWFPKFKFFIIIFKFRLPTPALPDFSIFLDVLPDAIIISLVGFATSVSIADLYARKHKYKINYNQVWQLISF